MTHEEFVSRLWEEVAKCPSEWREGQKVFNVVDATFGVARAVQFEDGVDCFYDDSQIVEFIEKAWRRVR